MSYPCGLVCRATAQVPTLLKAARELRRLLGPLIALQSTFDLRNAIYDTVRMDYVPPNVHELAKRHPGAALGWYTYAEAWLNFPLGKLLDYGCGQGQFVSRISHRTTECWGIDVDEEVIPQTARVFGTNTACLKPNAPLPFPDETFDTVLMLEVIEHVPDERFVLAEARRVLKPGGFLLLTTPHKGLLTFLDPANFKALAPTLHKWVYVHLMHKKQYYEERFGAARQARTGLFGSIAVESRWHRHYRFSKLANFLPPGLSPVAHRVYSPGMRGFWLLKAILRVLTRGRVQALPWPLSRLEIALSRRETILGDQLVALFERSDSPR